MKLPSKSLERNLFRKGYHTVVAVDEVGMGSLAGPVMVCAVAFTKNFYEKTHRELSWLRDSKLLSAHQRQRFVRELLQKPHIRYRVSFCYPYTIDRLNIYQAARHAMR